MGSQSIRQMKHAPHRMHSEHPTGMRPRSPAHWMLQLQRRIGNRGVTSLVDSGRLRVSQPTDHLELEADRVANQVMRMPDRRERGAASSDNTANTRSPNVSSTRSEGEVGRPLPNAVRSFFEPRFGHDFTQVRVHTDNWAAQSAHALNATAYTVGRDIVFGAGQYSPNTMAGKRLLAHELTHVVQQSNSSGVSNRPGAPPTVARTVAPGFVRPQVSAVRSEVGALMLQREVGSTGGAFVPRQTLAYGQVVHIEVRNAGAVESLTHDYPIDVNGKVKLPLLGLVQAHGLTPDQLADNIQAALQPDYLLSPTVNVTRTSHIVAYGALISYSPVHLRLLDASGDVQPESGSYPVRSDGTINLPYVGRVRARGRRLDVVEAEVQAGYRRDYVRGAVVHLTPRHLP
jgi:protein involved in polysaccharide export with SLBB domain